MLLFIIDANPALVAADRFLLLDAAKLTLRYKPALTADRAQDTAFSDFLTKALEQLLLSFIWAQNDSSQSLHLLSLLDSPESDGGGRQKFSPASFHGLNRAQERG
jgi:hypothetical protein